jgi:hypothetical protein
MEYLSGLESDHDQEIAQAVFLPFKEALDRLSFKGDKEILQKAKSLL